LPSAPRAARDIFQYSGRQRRGACRLALPFRSRARRSR
jgi:hypothetical protein